MRILAAIFILISAILSLFLGGFLFVSSKVETFEAKVKAEDDLSSVAGDLVSEEELAEMRQQEQTKQQQNAAIQGAGSRPLLLGVVASGAGLLQILCGILILLRRAKIPVLVMTLLSLAGLIVILSLEGAIAIGIIAAVTSAAALCCHAPALRAR